MFNVELKTHPYNKHSTDSKSIWRITFVLLFSLGFEVRGSVLEFGWIQGFVNLVLCMVMTQYFGDGWSTNKGGDLCIWSMVKDSRITVV